MKNLVALAPVLGAILRPVIPTCLYSSMLAKYAKTRLPCAPLHHMEGIKDLPLHTEVVIITVNMIISCLFVLTQPSKFLICGVVVAVPIFDAEAPYFRCQCAGLEKRTDTVANATNLFCFARKNLR